MPDDDPNDPADAGSSEEEPASPARHPSQRTSALSAEQRRFLGTPRSQRERAEKEKEDAGPEVSGEERISPTKRSDKQQPSAARDKGQEGRPRSAAPVAVDGKLSRVLEMQRAFLIIGAILLLFLAFYAGKKFSYWKYLLTARLSPELSEKTPDRFPGVSANELIEQALALEQANKWREAGERFVAAKNKDLARRGILFHVGKLLFDHRDFETADRVFARAIAFGEDVDKSYYFRGVIATQRRDLPGAARFFEAAVEANPFSPDHYYFWAEVLRMDFHPREAIPRYEQAAVRAENSLQEKVNRFKIRMALIEAFESAKVSAEIETKKSEGPLSVDWLMTAAGLRIHEDRIPEAVALLMQARAGSDPGLFAACVKDRVFRAAAAKHPSVADACRTELDLLSTSP